MSRTVLGGGAAGATGGGVSCVYTSKPWATVEAVDADVAATRGGVAGARGGSDVAGAVVGASIRLIWSSVV